MSEYAYVYILASSFRKLYIGITSDLDLRIQQHKAHTNPGAHTARYHIHDLVYYERFTSILAAIRREKVLKGWTRLRKLELIIATNPHWNDLSEAWGKQIQPFDLSREKELIRPANTFPKS